MRDIKFNAVNQEDHSEYIVYNQWLDENGMNHNDDHEDKGNK